MNLQSYYGQNGRGGSLALPAMQSIATSEECSIRGENDCSDERWHPDGCPGGSMTLPYGHTVEITYPAGRQCQANRRNQRNTIRFDLEGSKLNCSAVSPLPTKALAFAGAPELRCPYLSSRQAMPGSSKPSRNSREAPPPVEMWVILSAKPSCSQAAAESPPPTMVIASESARA